MCYNSCQDELSFLMVKKEKSDMELELTRQPWARSLGNRWAPVENHFIPPVSVHRLLKNTEVWTDEVYSVCTNWPMSLDLVWTLKESGLRLLLHLTKLAGMALNILGKTFCHILPFSSNEQGDPYLWWGTHQNSLFFPTSNRRAHWCLPFKQ